VGVLVEVGADVEGDGFSVRGRLVDVGQVGRLEGWMGG
jgi:hypothetical protein